MAASISALVSGPMGSANSWRRKRGSLAGGALCGLNGTILARGLLRYVSVSERPARTAWRIRPNSNRISWVEMVSGFDDFITAFIMFIIMFRRRKSIQEILKA